MNSMENENGRKAAKPIAKPFSFEQYDLDPNVQIENNEYAHNKLIRWSPPLLRDNRQPYNSNFIIEWTETFCDGEENINYDEEIRKDR